LCDELKRRLLEMRRTQEDFECEYKKFEAAKKEYTKILETWDINEARRKGNWESKLQTSFKTLEKERAQILLNSISSVSDSFGPKLHPSPEFPDTFVFDNKQEANVFFEAVYDAVASSLSGLRRNFVVAIRGMATKARDDRLNSLHLGMASSAGASGDDIYEKLKERTFEYLMDTKGTISSFSSSRIGLTPGRKLKEHYSASTAFHDLRRFIAKGYDSSGFMVQAPVTVVASLSLVLSAGVWPFMTRSKGYEVSMKAIEEKFDSKVAKPFVKSLKSEAEKTLEGVLKDSAEAAKAAVMDILAKEEIRYQIEKSKKGKPADKLVVANTLACFINFQAAESALTRLREHLLNAA